ncbi:MAG: hypothetical protein A2987_00725 [Omnitrophica bacterium RIFCSPLOWO2_01_FULL_45_10]|nr:MAG: hypothetical protein A2987_00725 [Omnitrophica bacterium RIFCSPLOWO2_01_FULL_45_10]
MKLISRDTDYAVRALSRIARNGNKISSVSNLAKETAVPRPFLRKILQTLNKKGVVNSSKGRGGGFVLARGADKIYLVELINIFQGPIKLNQCLFKKKICHEVASCVLKSKMDALEKNMISELKSITIAVLI